MKPVKLINLVKKLFPEATVTIAVADPLVEGSSHLVSFSAYGTGVCIDCSDDGYSIYDNVGDDELHLSFKDLLHVLPFIYRCLDSGKAEPELPQYDEFCRGLSVFNLSQLFDLTDQVSQDSHIIITHHLISFYNSKGDFHVHVEKKPEKFRAYISLEYIRYQNDFTDLLNLQPLLSFCFGSVVSGQVLNNAHGGCSL